MPSLSFLGDSPVFVCRGHPRGLENSIFFLLHMVLVADQVTEVSSAGVARAVPGVLLLLLLGGAPMSSCVLSWSRAGHWSRHGQEFRQGAVLVNLLVLFLFSPAVAYS